MNTMASLAFAFPLTPGKKEVQTSQAPFAAWFRQRASDLLDGLDLTQVSPGSLSRLVYDLPGVEEDEDSYHTLEEMKRRGEISP
jgi:hypothetical protein